MSEEKKNVWLEILKLIPWKKIGVAIYDELRPKFAKKIADSESKWDDAALSAADLLVNKFLKEE